MLDKPCNLITVPVECKNMQKSNEWVLLEDLCEPFCA